MIGRRTLSTIAAPLTACSLIPLLTVLPGGELTTHSQVVAAVGQNFTASTLKVDANSVPPDSDGAAGPSHYVEFINGRFAVFDKLTGTKVKTMTDVAFWQQAGLTFPAGWDITDPRIIYDPASQRWFAAQVDFDPTGRVNTNRFLLAVSANSDPTGAWKGLGIPSNPGGNNFADFPTLGLDAEGVYLSGDMFDSSSFPVGPTLISLPKSGLLATPPVATNLTRFGVMSYSTRGDILQPAICLDGSGQGQVLSTASVGIDDSGNFVTNKSLVSFRVQNATGPGKATLTSSSFLTVPPYTVPLNPIQPDGSDNLDDGDARFSASVYVVGGVLYAVHNTQVNNAAVLRWYRIEGGTQKVLESGTISDGTKDLFFPSIAANAAGTVVIAYNAASLNTFVSSFAVVGSTVNGVTTFGKPIQLKAGSFSYQNTDAGGTSRWGDYSATCVDPLDPNVFWTIQEYPSSHTAWSTQVTQISTGFALLHLATAGDQLQLSWSGTLFTLQTTDNLVNAQWTAVSQNLSTNNGVVTALLPISASKGFYRLRTP